MSNETKGPLWLFRGFGGDLEGMKSYPKSMGIIS